MTPQAIAQLILQFLPYGISLTKDIVTILHKKDPTLADWLAALDKAQTPFDKGLLPGVIQPNPTTPVLPT